MTSAQRYYITKSKGCVLRTVHNMLTRSFVVVCFGQFSLPKEAYMADVLHKVVVQCWEACERGSAAEPDGYSLHLSETHRQKFVDAHNAQLPGSAPETYTYPYGTPYMADVDAVVLAEIMATRHGVRKQGPPPEVAAPGSAAGR